MCNLSRHPISELTVNTKGRFHRHTITPYSPLKQGRKSLVSGLDQGLTSCQGKCRLPQKHSEQNHSFSAWESQETGDVVNRPPTAILKLRPVLFKGIRFIYLITISNRLLSPALPVS